MLSARAARARAASYATLRSAYFWSCAVYAAYAIGILRIDFCSPASSPDCSASAVNAAYTGWGVVHLINALQYLTSWLQAGVPLRRLRVTAPDWGNVLGAMLYLASAAGYGDVEKEGPGGPAAARGRRLELAASLVEVAAAYGWTRVWLDALPAGAAALGRGMVLSDPDAWGNALIVLPSFIYLLYNAQITADPAQYGARARVRGVNTLYKAGDVLYWVGSVFYLLASLRDAGWFASLAGPLLPEQGLRGGDEDEGLGHHPAAATQGTEMARVDEEKAGLLDDAAASAAAAAGRGGDCAPSSPPAPGGADARA